jgi:hypothetical protein
MSRITALPATTSSPQIRARRPNPGIAGHPGIALVRIDARLGRLTCEGSPNNTNAAINNAENIDWSPAFVGPPGGRVLKLSAWSQQSYFTVDLEIQRKEKLITEFSREPFTMLSPSESFSASCDLPPNAGFAGKSGVSV